MYGYDNFDTTVGIVIDQYPSVAAVVRIMRKYTNDSMMDIRNHMSRNEYVMSCDSIDTAEVRKLIKCIEELKKNKITVKIIERGEEIELQYLKNWVRSSRESEIQVEAEAELEAGEVSRVNFDEFRFLWEEEQAEWVVLKDGYDYTIFNIKTRMVLLIDENDELADQVAAMMILQGNRVIDGKDEIDKVLKET